jgi:hypothetical protein
MIKDRLGAIGFPLSQLPIGAEKRFQLEGIIDLI